MRGGARKGAGRKPKSKEMKLIQAMDKYMKPEEWAMHLYEVIENASGHKIKLDALKLWADFRFSKPKTELDVTGSGISINPIKWVGDGKPVYQLNGEN